MNAKLFSKKSQKKLARAPILLRTPQVSESKVSSNSQQSGNIKRTLQGQRAPQFYQLIINSISKVALFRDNI